MKIILSLIAAFGFLGLINYNAGKADVNNETIQPATNEMPAVLPAKIKSPVLVELFTSEGCSSCPPADKNLIFLERQPNPDAEVITLALHVDYWNRLGWTDAFSSTQFSERQGFYSNTFRRSDVYTPQMVVDGTHEFVGGNIGAAQKAISESAKTPKATIVLAVSGDKLNVKISDLPEHTFANIFLAIAENNLLTRVKSGENGGKNLSHTAVVRELRTIGSIAAKDNNFEIETAFQIPGAARKENLKLVVFVQIEKTSKIIGVSQIKL